MLHSMRALAIKESHMNVGIKESHQRVAQPLRGRDANILMRASTRRGPRTKSHESHDNSALKEIPASCVVHRATAASQVQTVPQRRRHRHDRRRPRTKKRELCRCTQSPGLPRSGRLMRAQPLAESRSCVRGQGSEVRGEGLGARGQGQSVEGRMKRCLHLRVGKGAQGQTSDRLRATLLRHRYTTFY